MAIGDDLQILLGMVPIRDRAGIARGTMADAAAAAAGNNPQTDGQRPPAFTLPPGMLTGSDGAQPPADVQLPDGVNTEYAAGSGGLSPAKSPSLGKGPVPGTPTADSERVVASSPMAAPSPAVATRGSEIMLKAMENQQRQEKMQQVFHALGQIVGGLRGESVPARAAGAGGSNHLNDMKTIIDMRAAEDQQAAALALRTQGIDTLRRKFGLSPEDAALYYDSDVYKKLQDPENIRKRRADELAAASIERLTPQSAVIAKMMGQPEAIVKEWIANGTILDKLDPEMRAKVEKLVAEGGKITTETGALAQKTEEERKSNLAYSFYKENPDAFARLHGLKDVDEARRIVGDRKAYDKFQETSGPTSYADEAQYHAYEVAERAAGREPISRLEWKKIRPGAETTDEFAAKRKIQQGLDVDKARYERYDKESQPARDAYIRLATIRKIQQDLWDENMITGAGKLSQLELSGRRTIARLLGRPDADVTTTQAFQAFQQQVAIELNQKLKGNTSDRDMQLLKKAIGGNEMTAEELRRFVMLQDIADQHEIHARRLEAESIKGSDPEGHQHMMKGLPGGYPPPNKLIREDIQSSPGLVKMAQDLPPDTVKSFERRDHDGRQMLGKDGKPIIDRMTVQDYIVKEWGPGGYEYARSLKRD